MIFIKLFGFLFFAGITNIFAQEASEEGMYYSEVPVITEKPTRKVITSTRSPITEQTDSGSSSVNPSTKPKLVTTKARSSINAEEMQQALNDALAREAKLQGELNDANSRNDKLESNWAIKKVPGTVLSQLGLTAVVSVSGITFLFICSFVMWKMYSSYVQSDDTEALARLKALESTLTIAKNKLYEASDEDLESTYGRQPNPLRDKEFFEKAEIFLGNIDTKQIKVSVKLDTLNYFEEKLLSAVDALEDGSFKSQMQESIAKIAPIATSGLNRISPTAASRLKRMALSTDSAGVPSIERGAISNLFDTAKQDAFKLKLKNVSTPGKNLPSSDEDTSLEPVKATPSRKGSFNLFNDEADDTPAFMRAKSGLGNTDDGSDELDDILGYTATLSRKNSQQNSFSNTDRSFSRLRKSR